MKNRVVVIDDDGTIGDLLQDFLGDFGYSCAVFQTTGEALDEINNDDIVVSDVHFEANNFGGIDMYLELQKKFPDRKNEIKFIFMTAYSIESIEEKMKILPGKLKILFKPFNLRDLLKFVREIRSEGLPENLQSGLF